MWKLFLHKRHKILIQSIVEWYQLTAGVEEPLLAKPNKQISYTSSVWFQDIIDFLYKHNITIFTKKILNITSQRKKDKCIMKEILQLNLSKTSLIQINSCRIYLKVFHLSDMIDLNGKNVGQSISQERNQHNRHLATGGRTKLNHHQMHGNYWENNKIYI